MSAEVKMNHAVWAEPHASRTGFVGRFQTARGIHTVTSPFARRVALVFPSEIAALKAAAAAICRHFDAEPTRPPAPTVGKVKEFAVRKEGRRSRAVSLR